MKSAFQALLDEARDRLRARYRKYVPLHFDWEPGARVEWTAWYSDDARNVIVFEGVSGEQSLRNLVEHLRSSE